MSSNPEPWMRMEEQDWSVFRAVQRIALSRFCQRTLENIRAASAGPAATAYERYQMVYQILKQQDQQLAALFDNARRSNAAARLLAMRAAGLVNDQEYAQFTAELRESLAKHSSDRAA